MRLSELTLGDLKSAPVPSPTRAPTKAPMRLSDLTSTDIDNSKSIMSDSVAAGVKGATVPDVGLIPTYNRANAALRTGVKTLNENWYNPSGALPQALYAMGKQGIDQSEAPNAEAVFDASPASGLLKNESFKKSFSDTPMGMPVKLGLLPFVGSEEASKIAGNVPEQAGRLITAGETDALSYVPGAVFEKPLAVAGKVASKLPGAGTVGKAMAWGAEQTTGVGRKLWEHYAKHADEIGQMAKNYVGENRYYQAFNDTRKGWGAAVDARKAQLGELIETGLANAPRKSNISTDGIIAELNNAKNGLHPTLHKSDIAEIDGMINKIREVAPEGKMSAWDAYHTQRYLHDRAARSFSEAGQIFHPSPKAAKAAKAARYKATELVNQHFPDTIKKANQEYVELHNIDDILPKSILDPEGSTVAITRGALNPNSREAEAMKKLGRFLYGDENRILHEAKNAATFEKMTNLGLNPLSGGGTTSTSRTIGGGLIAGGSQMSDDPVVKGAGAVVGGAIASPAIMKMGLDAGLLVPRAAKAVAGKGGLLEKGAEKVSPMLKALDKRMTPLIDDAVKGAGRFIKEEEGAFTPGQIKGLLKKEGTYDLKKAREVAGPAKGLLPGEAGNPVAPIGKVSEEDLAIFENLRKKAVREGYDLTPEEARFVQSLSKDPRIKDRLLRGDIEGLAKTSLEPDSGYPAQFARREKEKASKMGLAEAPPTPKQPRGLLTSLNVEKGPVKELPEAGGVTFLGENKVKPGPGQIQGQIFKGKSGPLAGKEFTVEKLPDQIRNSDGDLMEMVRFKDGSTQWVKKDDVFWGLRPDNDPYSPFASDAAKADQQKSLENIRQQMAKHNEWKKTQDAAEAERLKKNVVSLDVPGGKKGSAPKEVSGGMSQRRLDQIKARIQELEIDPDGSESEWNALIKELEESMPKPKEAKPKGGGKPTKPKGKK